VIYVEKRDRKGNGGMLLGSTRGQGLCEILKVISVNYALMRVRFYKREG
jgi:hypothetical protein